MVEVICICTHLMYICMSDLSSVVQVTAISRPGGNTPKGELVTINQIHPN